MTMGATELLVYNSMELTDLQGACKKGVEHGMLGMSACSTKWWRSENEKIRVIETAAKLFKNDIKSIDIPSTYVS